MVVPPAGAQDRCEFAGTDQPLRREEPRPPRPFQTVDAVERGRDAGGLEDARHVPAMREARVERHGFDVGVRVEHLADREGPAFRGQIYQDRLQGRGVLVAVDPQPVVLPASQEHQGASRGPAGGGCGLEDLGLGGEERHQVLVLLTAFISSSTRRGSTGFHQRPSTLSHCPTIAPSAASKSAGT